MLTIQDFRKLINGDGTINLDFRNLYSYYVQEFSQIYDSNESYKGRFNWIAFLFGPIWALTKGVWLGPVIAILTAVIVPVIPVVMYGILCGFRGNYIYYNAFVKNKQLFI